MPRPHPDRCPGVFRPWPAEDGSLVRLRLVGGRVSAGSLHALGEVAECYGDGTIHLTSRANLQVRGLPTPLGAIVEEALTATGLLPHPTHELVRNIMVSPLTGRAGGRADLRPVAAELDDLLCADPLLADLSARFLWVLDDGRGDLVSRSLDLGLVAVSAAHAQLRYGDQWGEIVPLHDAPRRLIEAAHLFREARDRATVGGGPAGSGGAWHVREVDAPWVTRPRDPRTVERSSYPGVGVPDGLLTPALRAALPRAGEFVVTPWRSLILPDQGG